ncbi:hypothetical protein HOP50_07g50120 [Chloropicon primus]|nr:hypothetical protein HOP50_07g50120 [Chloropicon primus]
MRDQMATRMARRTSAVLGGTSGRVEGGMRTTGRARRRGTGARGPRRREDCGHPLRQVRGTSSEVQEVQGLDEAGVDVEGLRLNEGRWKGILCNLTRFGSAQELPPMYVPDAFREWGETLYEWNTFCETRVEGARLTHDVRRQVPLTACESVQAQFEEEALTDSGDFHCVGDAGGNLLLASKAIGAQGAVLQASFAGGDPAAPTRTRVEVSVKRYDDGAPFEMASGKIVLEEKTELYMDSDELDRDGGVRQTNEVANTATGSPPDDASSPFIALPLDSWVRITSSADEPDSLVLAIGKGARTYTVTYEDLEVSRAEMS